MTKTTVSKNQYADSRDFMTSLLFRKWTIAIILSLGAETKRYSALHRSLPGVTQKVLTEHLKQLERAGIVRRFFYPTIPPRVEYKLTKTGLELSKLTSDITVWFDSHSEALQIPENLRQEACDCVASIISYAFSLSLPALRGVAILLVFAYDYFAVAADTE